MQERFEKWAKNNGWAIIPETKLPNRTYWMDGLEHCWRAWQAALDNTTPPPVMKEEG